MDAITPDTNNTLFRGAKELSKDSLQELASSIKELGVIQPVLLRQNPKAPGKFILISGERRFRASQLAGKADIPAYIKEVDEHTALIMQITENMQRKDVHPLNEARGYKLILDNDTKMNTKELALKFGKSETYIIQRLKLGDLVKEAEKDFYAGRMTLGHALILARLQPADQKQAIASLTRHGEDYGTVRDLENFVQRNIINVLSKAPFDLNDGNLHKKAGACMACPKRSGAAPVLFADIKEKDTCFDRNCFLTKCHKFLINRTRQVIETEPEVVFLTDYYDPDEEIVEILAQHKIKPLKQYSDFDNYKNQDSNEATGLWISGSKAGHIETVYVKKEAASQDAGNPEAQIERIKQRMKRGRELDREKVYAKILEGLKDHPTQKANHNRKLMPDEEAMLWFIIFEKANYYLRIELIKALKLPDDPEKFYATLKSLTPVKKAFMLRRVMMNQYGGNFPESTAGIIIRKIAEAYGDIDIATFEKEQAEICKKRETRAKERIKGLEDKNPDQNKTDQKKVSQKKKTASKKDQS